MKWEVWGTKGTIHYLKGLVLTVMLKIRWEQSKKEILDARLALTVMLKFSLVNEENYLSPKGSGGCSVFEEENLSNEIKYENNYSAIR